MEKVFPVEIEVFGQQIRQVLDRNGKFVVFPAFGERRVVYGDSVLPEAVTDPRKITMPFDVCYEHLRGKSVGPSQVLGEDILERVMDDFRLREMNGILILDNSLVNVNPLDWRGKVSTSQIERVKYSLCVFDKMGSLIFT